MLSFMKEFLHFNSLLFTFVKFPSKTKIPIQSLCEPTIMATAHTILKNLTNSRTEVNTVLRFPQI